MSAVKVDFTIPKQLQERLKRAIQPRQRSAFVAAAIAEKLNALERARLNAELREGYLATRDENAVLNREWEGVTLEGWPG